MITRADFAQIDNEIKDALNAAFDHARTANTENYILFLADGEYKSEYDTPKYSPYVIDNRTDKYQDETRLRFLTQFLNNFYSFNGFQSVDDNEQRIHMELMIYTHIWESKPFLKKLYRLAHINNGEAYQWDVQVPDMSKHEFIRDHIRDIFSGIPLHLTSVMSSGFHTQLRNAFAHSEYSFDDGHNRIWLSNYKGRGWDFENISYDDWSRRFVYSSLLSYYLLSITHQKRTAIPVDFQSNVFEVDHPKKSGGVERVRIEYRPPHDAFNFIH